MSPSREEVAQAIRVHFRGWGMRWEWWYEAADSVLELFEGTEDEKTDNALPDRIRALHTPHVCDPTDPTSRCMINFGGRCAKVGLCAACSHPMPCPTLHLLGDGA
jgi:hypothetical protein